MHLSQRFVRASFAVKFMVAVVVTLAMISGWSLGQEAESKKKDDPPVAKQPDPRPKKTTKSKAVPDDSKSATPKPAANQRERQVQELEKQLQELQKELDSLRTPTTAPAAPKQPATAPEAKNPTPPAKEAKTVAASEKTERTFNPAWLGSLSWRCVGPASMGGRIVDIAVVDSDPCCYFVATASGGLFKTTNNGVTFRPVFEHENSVSIGDVAIGPSNPDIVWVGTGEHNARNSVSWGDGVYKSTDGGKSWSNVGLKDS